MAAGALKVYGANQNTRREPGVFVGAEGLEPTNLTDVNQHK